MTPERLAQARNTAQRKAIREVFTRSGQPLAPREALESAQRLVPSLGMATIYRTLKALVAEGWLVAVDLPGEAPRYERAGKPHHHHFVCSGCERVFEVEGCPGNLEMLVPPAFRLDRHELVLYGVCATCRS